MTAPIRKPLAECPAALVHVCKNLREWDRREIYATRWDDDPGTLARDCLGSAQRGCGWVFFADDEPVAVLGGHPLHPGVWNLWCFGTDNFRQAGLSLTKYIKHDMIPDLVERKRVHRGECRSIEGHQEAHAWLELLGWHKEGLLVTAGRHQENFWQFGWRLRDVLQ